ncbi:MAG: hypothetical protein ACRC33_18870 [Gemmataceae bacterium]
MRPKAAVEPGKKVRCPKCETVFVAKDDVDEIEEFDEDEDERPRKKKAPAKAAAGKSKPKDEPKKKEGEESETYGYVNDDAEEEADEEAQERKRINYAPDESIRDLRGPAIVKLRAPSNFLTLAGFIGAGGWLVFMLLMAIPFCFPIVEDKKPDEQAGRANPEEEAKKAKAGPTKSTFHIWWNVDFYNGVINRWDNPALFWAIMFGFLLLALYSGLVSFGAIKLINMESRPWGIASAIMALLPINAAGLTFALAFGIQFGLRQIEIDEDSINYLTIGIGVLLWLISIGLGVWVLIAANDPVVIEGYEYEPE